MINNVSTNFLMDSVQNVVGVMEYIPQLLQHSQEVGEYTP